MHGAYCKEHDHGAFACARCGDISCWDCGKPKDTDTYKTIGSMYCAHPLCQRERKIEDGELRVVEASIGRDITKYRGMDVWVTLKVRAYVADWHDAHGFTVQLKLDQRDYASEGAREVWVDENEIIGAAV